MKAFYSREQGLPCLGYWQGRILLYFSSPSVTNYRLRLNPNHALSARLWGTLLMTNHEPDIVLAVTDDVLLIGSDI